MSGGNSRITPTSSETSANNVSGSLGHNSPATIIQNSVPFPPTSGSSTSGTILPGPAISDHHHSSHPSVPELQAILSNVTTQTSTHLHANNMSSSIGAASFSSSNTPHDFLVSPFTAGSSSSNLGIRTRHRSGTLPSRLNSSVNGASSLFSSTNGQNFVTSPSLSSSIWSSDGTQNKHPQAAPPLQQIPQITTLDMSSTQHTANAGASTASSTFSSLANVNRARSYSANNALLTAGDRQFLNHCSTITEEYPPAIDSLGQGSSILPTSDIEHPLHSLIRPRSQTLEFQPLFGGFQNGTVPQTIGNGNDFTSRRTQSFSEQQPQRAQLKLGEQGFLGNSLQGAQPLLEDSLPESAISITSTHTNSSLGPTNTLLIINIPRDPTLTNSSNFYHMMAQFGTILSVRVVVCADSSDLVVVVEFQEIDSAIRCRAKMNYQELIPGLSCIVAFAKIIYVDDKRSLRIQGANNENIGHQQQAQPPQNQHEKQQQQQQHPRSSSPPSSQYRQRSMSRVSEQDGGSISRRHSEQPHRDLNLNEVYDRFKEICEDLQGENVTLSHAESVRLSILLSRALKYSSTREYGLGKLPEQLSVRKFDTPRLREIRKQLDSNQMNRLRVEELALAMYDELPSLASDYLGNTIVQKLLVLCSMPVRDIVIQRLVPYLAQMGAHKNGTWAAQKMINTVASEREKWMISKSLSKFCVQLFNDQYANYVVHGMLKFGAPYNDFITEATCSCFMEISRNRFGARAIRTCMESEYAGKEFIVAVCACILTWCWELITDPNGSLLITWFLDTCNFYPDTASRLADRLCKDDDADIHKNSTTSFNKEARDLGLNEEDAISEARRSKLCNLCCSRLGHLGVLKLLNYRNDLGPRNMLLKKIFGNSILENDAKGSENAEPPYLVRILTDASANGPLLIYKILIIPTLDADLRTRLAQKVRIVLQGHNLIGMRQYKRLCEEIGLKTGSRSRAPSSASSGRRKKSRSRSGSINVLSVPDASVAGNQLGVDNSHRSHISPPLNSNGSPYAFPYENSFGLVDSSTGQDTTATLAGGHIHRPSDYEMLLNTQLEKLSLSSVGQRNNTQSGSDSQGTPVTTTNAAAASTIIPPDQFYIGQQNQPRTNPGSSQQLFY